MGAAGSCFDNAMMEAFWARLQVELLNRRRWKTRVELAGAIHDYIEHFHNSRRRHSALGMRTPAEVEPNGSSSGPHASSLGPRRQQAMFDSSQLVSPPARYKMQTRSRKPSTKRPTPEPRLHRNQDGSKAP